ncbi:caspase family protein [Variovorax dokdonensis]|uniref:Caspase family protein n=1 Tax=Variovorax dokdonensis TaxID=344883 RepID=A0ABT7NAJ5_9BURK|nr:caspase family protein [Variovorax dokdonensis]MDM0044952.1 caspase family protein [Variovorax dokdonensis]
MRSPLLRRLPHLLVLWLALTAALPASATARALLVGVSELANQSPSLWLQAPRNDVLLMRNTLQQQGVSQADISMLADGVAGARPPDAQGIHDALAALLARSRSGDFVLLYFSGHGTRVRDRAKRYAEPDGLAENFLARDAQLGPGGGDMPLAGGLRDVDFDGWIRAFLARGVFVWSVFDTCAAASMTRGVRSLGGDAQRNDPQSDDDPVRFRGIRVDQLAQAPAGTALPADLAPPDAPPLPRARYVAFFASESHQVTPELRLPRGDRSARPQGLLTWALAQALARRPASYRALYNDVVSLYAPVVAELESRFPARDLPSPVAEGNLDLPVLRNAPAPLSTRPVWPARRAGGQLAMSVGLLDGLEPGQSVRVLATLDDGTQRSANARLERVDGGSAHLPVPSALADAGDAALWGVTPLADPPSALLRVQAPRPLPDAISLAYPAAIRVVPEGGAEAADVQLMAEGGGTRLRILSAELAALTSAQPPALRDEGELRDYLAALAELKWLGRLRQLAQGNGLAGFEAMLETWAGDRLVRSQPALRADGQPLAAGERVALNVRNTSGQSIDLVVVGIEADGAVRQVYPQAISESNRFERGTREQPAQQRFDLSWLEPARGGRLLVVAAPAAPFSAPRLFGSAPPDALPGLRLRGALQRDDERQAYGALAVWPPGAPSTEPIPSTRRSTP